MEVPHSIFVLIVFLVYFRTASSFSPSFPPSVAPSPKRIELADAGNFSVRPPPLQEVTPVNTDQIIVTEEL
jgi:hypothetical protein